VVEGRNEPKSSERRLVDSSNAEHAISIVNLSHPRYVVYQVYIEFVCLGILTSETSGFAIMDRRARRRKSSERQ
jgi:hypothetical protein